MKGIRKKLQVMKKYYYAPSWEPLCLYLVKYYMVKHVITITRLAHELKVKQRVQFIKLVRYKIDTSFEYSMYLYTPKFV